MHMSTRSFNQCVNNNLPYQLLLLFICFYFFFQKIYTYFMLLRLFLVSFMLLSDQPDYISGEIYVAILCVKMYHAARYLK